MPLHMVDSELLILTALSDTESITIEELAAKLPELSWSQLFQAIDTLSRRNAIVLRRRGFAYDLKAAKASSSFLR